MGDLFAMANTYDFVEDTDTARGIKSTLLERFVDAQLVKPADASKVSDIKFKLTHINERLKVLLAEEKDAPPKSNVIDTQLAKDIRDRVADIKLFGPGSELSVFLRECEVVYDTLVKNKGDVIEAEFTRKLKMRIDFDYLGALNSANENMAKWSDFKTYMEENHSSSESHYQVIEELESLSKLESESYKDYALRINLLTRRVETVVKARWSKKNQSVTVKPESGSDKTPEQMSAHDVFELIGGVHLLKAVRQDAPTYAAVCSDLDSCWNACAIATKAANFADKCRPDTKVTEPNSVFHATHKKNANAQVCFKFLRGKCKSDDCEFSHDHRVLNVMKRMVDESKSKGKDNDDDGSRNRRNQSRRGGHRQGGQRQGSTANHANAPPAEAPIPPQSNHFDINLDNVQGFPQGPSRS